MGKNGNIGKKIANEQIIGPVTVHNDEFRRI